MKPVRAISKMFLRIGIPFILLIVLSYGFYALIYQTSLGFDLSVLVLPFFLSFIISILWHEIGHLFSFLIQKYEIKGFFVLGFGFTNKPFRVHFEKSFFFMLGGIVIPKLLNCDSDVVFEKRKNELKRTLLFGPIFTYILPVLLLFLYLFHPSPFLFMMIMYILGIGIVVHKSFFISFESIYGDLKAYQFLKRSDDLMLLIYHQHMMLYDIGVKTKQYIYEKAYDVWNQKDNFNIKNDMHLMMMVIDGTRFGFYSNKNPLKWEHKDLSRHTLYKRQSYQHLLVYHVYMQLYLKRDDVAAQYYTYMLHHEEKYTESLALLHTFMYHKPMSDIFFMKAKEDLSIYRYVVDDKVFKEYFKSEITLDSSCNI